MLRRALALATLLLVLAHAPIPAALADGEAVSAWRTEGPPGAVAPGDSVRFGLDVVNHRMQPVEGYLSAEELTSSFYPSADTFGMVRIEPGHTLRVNVTAYLPEDLATGTYELRLVLSEPGDPGEPATLASWSLDVLPAPGWAVSLETGSSGSPGETVELRVHAENLEEAPVQLHLDAFDPEGILAPTLNASSLDLAPGAAAQVVLAVTLPPDGDRPWHDLVVRATRVDAAAPVRETRASLFVRPPGPTTHYAPTPAPPPSSPGGDFSFTFEGRDETITASGGRAVATFIFTTQDGSMGEVSYRVREAQGRFDLGASAQGSFFLLPDRENVQHVTLDVSRAEPETYRLVFEFFRARDDSYVGGQYATLVVPSGARATLPSTGAPASAPRLEITQMDGSEGVHVRPGADAEARLGVRLVDGASPVVVNLSFRALPAGWKVEWPSSFAVAPGETRVVTLRVRAPEDAATGAAVSLPFRATTGGATSRVDGALAATVEPPLHGDFFWTLGDLASAYPMATGGAVVGVGAALVAIPLWRREWWRYLMALPLLPLYTRLRKAEVLDHETRERIHQMIVREPGIHYSALKDATGLNVGALVHHLRTLERHGLVASRREGVLRRFYPAGQRLPPAPAVPLTPTQARLVDMLAAQPLTQRELAARLGVTQQGVSYHLKTLERKGIVVAQRDGAETRYAPAASAVAAPTAPSSRGLA